MMPITLDPVGRAAVELVPGVWFSSLRAALGGLAGEQADSVLVHRRARISQHRKAKGKSVARHVWTCDSSAD